LRPVFHRVSRRTVRSSGWCCVISAYCKKQRGYESDHDRCYGKGEYLTCDCECHKEEA